MEIKETEKSKCDIVTDCIRKICQSNPIIVPTSDKKVILIRNCYWHMHTCRYGRVKPATNVAFWEKKRRGNKERDKKSIAALRRLGWSVLVVWECQVRDVEKVRRRVCEFLAEK